MLQTKNTIDPVDEIDEVDDDLTETEDNFKDDSDSDDEIIDENEIPVDEDITVSALTGEDDDDDDNDTVETFSKVTVVKKLAKGDNETGIRRVPVVGSLFRSKNFTIEIVGKKGKQYDCKVITSVPPSRRVVGEFFQAEEIAFYSEYYTFAGMVK
jgi:hypothetical protein